jgi:hypothetical protein
MSQSTIQSQAQAQIQTHAWANTNLSHQLGIVVSCAAMDTAQAATPFQNQSPYADTMNNTQVGLPFQPRGQAEAASLFSILGQGSNLSQVTGQSQLENR